MYRDYNIIVYYKFLRYRYRIPSISQYFYDIAISLSTSATTAADADSASETEELHLFTIGAKATTPISVALAINGKQLTMEVDTGAAVSIISEHSLKAIVPDATLQPSRVVLKTYTEERMTVLGELHVKVQYGRQSKTLPVIVVAGDRPSLFGRNWLESIRLNWHNICAISSTSASVGSLESLLEKHQEIFKDELGTIKSFPAKLQVRPEA